MPTGFELRRVVAPQHTLRSVARFKFLQAMQAVAPEQWQAQSTVAEVLHKAGEDSAWEAAREWARRCHLLDKHGEPALWATVCAFENAKKWPEKPEPLGMSDAVDLPLRAPKAEVFTIEFHATWNPHLWLETLSEAKKRILAEFEEYLTWHIEDYVREAERAGWRIERERRRRGCGGDQGTREPRWEPLTFLVRYLVLRRTAESLAEQEQVDVRNIRAALREAADEVGLRLRRT